jgi:hypothetical protein
MIPAGPGASSARRALPALVALVVVASLAAVAPTAARAQAPAVPAVAEAAATLAATAPRGEDGQVLRVFEIRYRSVSEVTVLVSPLVSPGALLEMNAATRTVTVRDRPDVVRHVEEFLRQFDVPPHAVIVRIVVEKAERASRPGVDRGDDVATEASGWSFERLADTTLEVLERGHATQSFGPDATLEIHVRLDSVDAERRLMNFDEFRLARRAAVAGGATEPASPPSRELLSTALELQDRVGKVVMAARSAEADEGLVVRVIGLIRDGAVAER